MHIMENEAQLGTSVVQMCHYWTFAVDNCKCSVVAQLLLIWNPMPVTAIHT